MSLRSIEQPSGDLHHCLSGLRCDALCDRLVVVRALPDAPEASELRLRSEEHDRSSLERILHAVACDPRSLHRAKTGKLGDDTDALRLLAFYLGADQDG
jgi:hypothetical protein